MMQNIKIVQVIISIVILVILSLLGKLIIEKANDNNIFSSWNQVEEKSKVEEDDESDEIDEVYKENVIGTLEIPKLDMKAEIHEGIDIDTLAEYIGHFTNSSIWDGNVALASHNRGSSVVHYFEGIHLLDVGDEIIYNTNMGERRYKVISSKKIDNTDWSVTLNTKENKLTLITCITGEPESRLCVQAQEI